MVEDGLWERIEPLLPQVKRNPRRPGRPRLDDRKVLCGILFVLYTGIRWEFLPQELGFGSGMTCRRRLRDWSDAGVWLRLHEFPLAATLTGGNRKDVTQLIPLLQAVPPIRGKRGRPRRRPEVVYADRGHNHDKYRRLVRELGVTPVIARRGTEHGSVLGVYRWVAEAAFALLHWFRRLRIRWEIRDDIHEAFLTPGCAIICRRRLKTSLVF